MGICAIGRDGVWWRSVFVVSVEVRLSILKFGSLGTWGLTFLD